MSSKNSENANEQMKQLIQLLALKIESDKRRDRNQVKLSVVNFDKTVSNFDVYSVPVARWLKIFERNADAYELSEKQNYVHARGKMSGAARLFLE